MSFAHERREHLSELEAYDALKHRLEGLEK